MKKIIVIITVLCLALEVNAAKLVVSLSNDNPTNPVAGMLRYCIKNANNGDTISFAVDSVGLASEISIAYKSLTIDGGKGVIIDGGKKGRVFNISFDSNNTIVISNITIQNGFLDKATAWGAGMYAFGSGEGLFVRNCTFKNNIANATSDGQGGALRTQQGTYTNCFFLNNAVTGPGASNSGGAIMSLGAKFINCVVAGNKSKYAGGMYAMESTIINCTLTQNSASETNGGGGITSESASSFTNCIIYKNLANGIHQNVDNVSGTFSYCAFETGNPLINSTCIGLTATPFIHSGTDSLSLKAGAPCIDKGNSSVANLPEYDIVGTSRIYGSKVDIGAYEYYVPIIIKGRLSIENGAALSNTTLFSGIKTDANGDFQIVERVNNIKKGDTLLLLLTPPAGYEFYPKKIIVNSSRTENIVAYKGIVVDEAYPAGSINNWSADTVNVFTSVIVNNSKLTIQPNTKVKFHGFYGIRVSGTGSIKAIGTSSNPILFTSADTTAFSFEEYWSSTGAWNKIEIENMSSDADSSIFENCIVQYSKDINNAGDRGGALFVSSFNKVRLKSCKLRKNGIAHIYKSSSVAGGGAIYIDESNIEISYCDIYNNYDKGQNGYNIWGGGGGIYVNRSDAKIIGCNIYNNTVTNGHGGGIHFNCGLSSGETSILTNCNIYDNFASDSGGGVFFDRYAFPQIINCNIVYNKSGVAGGGIHKAEYVYGSNDGLVYNSIVYGNEANGTKSQISGRKKFEIFHCNIEGGNTFEATRYEDCINIDPLFVNKNEKKFSLQVNSPCINAGTTSIIEVPSYFFQAPDLAGNLRVMGDSIDIGAYEFEETTLYIDAPKSLVGNASVQFKAKIVKGTASSWSWDFDGDGLTDSNEQNPTFVYSNGGNYKVRLIAFINELGRTDTAFHQISISLSPIANFSVNVRAGRYPLTVYFTDESTNNPTSWSWDFGDGNTSKEQHPRHTFNNVGSYTVKLTVTNAVGSDEEIKTDYVKVLISPQAFFTADKTFGSAPLTVNFTDESVNNPTSWSWDFGDGTTNQLQNPSHTFSSVGTYTIKLTATNAAGSDVEIKTSYVKVAIPPTALFSVNKTVGGAPLTIKFIDESTNVPTSWSWDFGDGTTSQFQHPSHTFTKVGTYTVKLTATNIAGSDEEIKTDFIVVNTGVGVDDVEDGKVNVFPNPTTELVNITTNAVYVIQVMDISGKVLLDNLVVDGKTTIDLSLFPEGLYLIKFTSSNDSFTRKIIKKGIM